MSNHALHGERGEGGFEPNGTGAVGQADWSNVSSSKSAHNTYCQKLMLSYVFLLARHLHRVIESRGV